jgi:hypothetical protein
MLYRGDVTHTGLDNIGFLSRTALAVVEDAGDILHTQRNAFDSGYLLDTSASYSRDRQPVRFLAQGRDASATMDSACGAPCGNDGDNEITGIHASDGDPSRRVSSGRRRPDCSRRAGACSTPASTATTSPSRSSRSRAQPTRSNTSSVTSHTSRFFLI